MAAEQQIYCRSYVLRWFFAIRQGCFQRRHGTGKHLVAPEVQHLCASGESGSGHTAWLTRALQFSRAYEVPPPSQESSFHWVVLPENGILDVAWTLYTDGSLIDGPTSLLGRTGWPKPPRPHPQQILTVLGDMISFVLASVPAMRGDAQCAVWDRRIVLHSATSVVAVPRLSSGQMRAAGLPAQRGKASGRGHVRMLTGNMVWCWHCGAHVEHRAKMLIKPRREDAVGTMRVFRDMLRRGLHPRTCVQISSGPFPETGVFAVSMAGRSVVVVRVWHKLLWMRRAPAICVHPRDRLL